MRVSFLAFFIVLFTLTSAVEVHKFYVSVTHVNYSEKDDALQITTRIFIDDLEKVLKERYTTELQLATDQESEQVDALIEKYMRSKLTVELSGVVVPFEFLGKKYDNDVAICYIEVPGVDLAAQKSIAVQNEVLTDIFEEQKNIVHIKCKGIKESFVLIKGNDKGMLNL